MTRKNDIYTSSLFGNDEAYQADVARAKEIQKTTGKKPKKTSQIKFAKAKADDSVNKETERLEKKGRKEAEENRRLIAQGRTRDMFESRERVKQIVRETLERFVKDLI
jgi:hypothetical protein